VFDGSRFEVACKLCAMRLVVAGIRAPEAKAIADHLRTQHPWLGLPDTAALDDVLDHYRVTPTRR